MKKDFELSTQEGVMRFLQSSTGMIAEFLTGIFVSDDKDWKLSAGKLVQATIKGTLLTQFGREVEKYRKDGRIKEDYFATEKARASLYEFLKFLDDEVPDDDFFRALKSIFFSGVSVNATEQEEALAYEFLKTARKLSGTEVLILKANFEVATGKLNEKARARKEAGAGADRRYWRMVIAEQMGLGELDSIVMKYELNLESLGLIGSRVDNPSFQTEFTPTHHFRLTNVGFKFCEFAANYE